MNPRLAGLLARLYPRSWRERYRAEFEELLETGRGDFRTVANVVWSGLHERICPTEDSPRPTSQARDGYIPCARERRGPSLVSRPFASCRLLHCGLFDSADRLDNFLAGKGYAFWRRTDPRVGKSLFSIRQIFLWQRADSRGLGGCSPGGPSTGESNLALDRLRSSGMDGSRGADSSKPDGNSPRTGAYPHGLCPLAMGSKRARRFCLCTGHSLACGAAVSALANSHRANDVLLISTSTTGPTDRKVWSAKNGDR